jgi:hypothetical protein
MLIKFFDEYTLNDKRPLTAESDQSKLASNPSADLNFTDRRVYDGSMSMDKKMMLMYMDNSNKFMDLLLKFKEEDKVDAKAYENIVEIARKTDFFDAEGNPKPAKMLENLTDVRDIINDFDKEKKADKKN